jgi:PAS domain S-box-containing protein
MNVSSEETVTGTHILYVGPDPVDACRIEMMLHEAGAEHHTVEEAGSIDAAIDCLADGCAEIVLLDLPGESGLDALRRIAGAAPEVAIVVLEESEGACDVTEAVRLGAQDVLPRDEITGPALARALRLAVERSRARQELGRIERRYRTLFDSVPTGIVRVLPDGTLVDVNEAFVDLLGYPDKPTLLTTRVFDLLADPATFMQITSQFKEHDVIRKVVTELQGYDGSPIWIEGSAHAVRDEYGQIICVEAMVRDVTDQRQVREVMDSLARLPFENPNVVMRLSSGGEVLYANPAGSRFLEMADLAGGIPERWREIVRQALRGGSPIQLAASYGQRSFHFTFAPIPSADYVNVYASDITELKRAEAAEREQRVIAEALQESTAVLNSTLDPDEVLRLILMTASRVVPSDGSLLVLVEDGIGQVSHCDGYYVEEGICDEVLRISAPVHTFRNWKQMAETGQPVVIDDTRKYSGWVKQKGMEDVRSHLGTPIIHQGELLGFINLTSKSPSAFTDRHARYLKAFSDQVAIAIRNAKLYETEQHRRRIAETLRRASAVFSSTLALDEVLNRIMEQLGEVLPYDSASVQQLEDGRLVIRAVRGFEDSAGLIGQSFPITPRFPNMQVIETKQPLALADPVKSYPAFYEDSDKYQSSGIRTWLGVPLIASDQAIGLITLDRNALKPYTDDEIKLAAAFANHAATALENARLYAELENYSSILVQAIHEATNELRQTLEHLQAILDNSPDTILLLAHDGTIETANPAFEKLFGYPQEQVIGQQVHKLLDDADAPAFHDALDAVCKQHVTQRLEATARRKNEGAFDVESALAPIMEDERLLGIVCSLRDISAFKEVERMKDALVSTAAHELRTPLTTIQGFSELLLTRDLGKDRHSRYLRLINQQSEELASIVNDLLDVSRLESGHGLDLKPEPIAIAPIIYEAAEPFVETSPHHAFEFVGLNDAPQVHGDPIRLGQVVKNLVSNAVKYSPDGGPVIIRAQTENGSLRVSVQDEGIGINGEQLPHIFEKFYRADASNTAVSGTGLGLTICKLIVEGHGGSIGVESEYGRGSTFMFNIPLANGQSNRHR